MRHPSFIPLEMILLFLCMFLSASSSFAKERKFSDKAPLISEKTYKRIAKAHELLRDKKFNEALDSVASLEQLTKGKVGEYAQVLQVKAYVYAGQNQFKEAAVVFEDLLDLDEVPKAIGLNTLLTLAQIYSALERYDQSIELANEWLSLVEEQKPEAYLLLAGSHAQLKQWSKAEVAIKKAIEMKKGTEIPLSWQRILLAIYFEQKKYQESELVLKELISLAPKEEVFWRQWVSVLLELKRDEQALVAGKLAFKGGFLRDESSLRQLMHLSMSVGAPFHIASLYEPELQAGRVEKTAANWLLLADAWALAREHERSLSALAEAGKLAEDGSVSARRGMLLLDLERWEEAVQEFALAIKKGSLKKPGQVNLAMGIAKTQLKEFSQAKAFFQRAADDKDESISRQAQEWLRHVAEEQGSS